MSVLEELTAKISTAQKSAADVVEQLGSFSDIKETLRSTNTSLAGTSEKLSDLALCLKSGADSLLRGAESLDGAAALLKASDSASLHASQQAMLSLAGDIQKQIGNLGGEIGKLVDDAVSTSGRGLETSLSELIGVKTREASSAIEAVGVSLQPSLTALEAGGKSSARLLKLNVILTSVATVLLFVLTAVLLIR